MAKDTFEFEGKMYGPKSVKKDLLAAGVSMNARIKEITKIGVRNADLANELSAECKAANTKASRLDSDLKYQKAQIATHEQAAVESHATVRKCLFVIAVLGVLSGVLLFNLF